MPILMYAQESIAGIKMSNFTQTATHVIHCDMLAQVIAEKN